MPPPARGCHSAVRRSGGGLRNTMPSDYLKNLSTSLTVSGRAKTATRS